MLYYVEKEDELKNPSYKRCKHRYFEGVDFNMVNGWNDALCLAGISVDMIREELKELV